MFSELTIACAEKAGLGRYWTETGAGEAELLYCVAKDGAMIVDHVYVPKAARGRGVGRALVERAEADARDRRRPLVPACPFASTTVRRLSAA